MPRTANPYDELAAMFLTGSAGDAAATAPAPRTPSSTRPARPRAAKPVIELLIAGHLPVRGNVWLAPYADALAQRSGPAALVRLDGPEPNLQLLHAGDEWAQKSLPAALSELIEKLAGDVEVWIMRAPTGWTPADLFAVPPQRVDRITILTSADEAALVAAYQTIKEFADARPGGAHLPPIRLAIVGADEKLGAAVIERMNRTTASFLDVRVESALCLPRIDAGVMPTRYVSLANQRLELSEVAAVIDRCRKPLRDDAGAVDAAHTAGRKFPQPPPTVVPPAARTATDCDPAPPMVPSADIAPSNGTVHSQAKIKLAPKPSLSVEPKPVVAADESRAGELESPGFARHVAGLTLLPVRSPGHEGIELAVDGPGGIHLLGAETALREMPLVVKWVKSHGALIVMACPQFKIDVAREPRCHLFAQQPTALADLHGGDLCLHVLAPVAVNGETGWYCAALNVVGN